MVCAPNYKLLYAKAVVTSYERCFLFNEGFNQLINVFRNCGIEDSAKGNLRRILLFSWHAKEKERIYLQRIPIAFHAVPAFPRETLRYQRLPLLRCSGFQCHNQGGEEVQEHELPSACRRTTVSLHPRTQIHRRKR